MLTDQKRNLKSPDNTAQAGYATNFGSGANSSKSNRSVESYIVGLTFKTLITRLTATPKEIKAPENMVCSLELG